MKKNIIKFTVCGAFYIVPIIINSCVLNSMINGQWNIYQPQNILYFIGAILVFVTLSWLAYKVITHSLTDFGDKDLNFTSISGFATIIGIIFVIFTAYNYAPSYEMILATCLLFCIQILSTVFNKKETKIAFSFIILVIIGGIIINIHPVCNYENYSKKVNDAINYMDNEQYYAAIDSFNLLLDDKYFMNNYSDSLAKLALVEKNNATHDITFNIKRGVRPSVSISSPTKIENGYEYKVYFSNHIEDKFSEHSIVLNDFKATINIKNIDEDSFSVELNNIKGSSGKKNIYILSGAAENENGHSLTTPHSVSFLHINQFEKAITIFMCIVFLLIPLLFVKKIWSEL